jgi:hypothetical protein
MRLDLSRETMAFWIDRSPRLLSEGDPPLLPLQQAVVRLPTFKLIDIQISTSHHHPARRRAPLIFEDPGSHHRRIPGGDARGLAETVPGRRKDGLPGRRGGHYETWRGETVH